MGNFVLTTIQNIAGVLLQFCQMVHALLSVNVSDLIVNGLTIEFNNPFGISLANLTLPGWADFGAAIVDLFELIPGATLDITFLQFIFNVAVLTIVIRIIGSVVVR